jgi:hypothetical protein
LFFIFCSSIGPYRIARHDASRTVLIGDHIFRCSPTQYHLLLPLLEGKPVSDDVLHQAAFGDDPSPPTRKAYTRRIEHLREKLHPCGLTIERHMQTCYILRLLEEQAAS